MAYLAEEFRIRRRTSIAISVAVVVVLGTFCSLSQSTLSDFQIGGYNLFDFCDKLTANILMPTGALIVVLYVGWWMKRADFLDEITSSGRHRIAPVYLKIIQLSIKYLAPVVISIIMIRGILQELL